MAYYNRASLSGVKVEPPDWQSNVDEQRRAFIIENCAAYGWSIKDMDDLLSWLRDGTIATAKPGLKSVK